MLKLSTEILKDIIIRERPLQRMQMFFSCLYKTDPCIFARMKAASPGGLFQHMQKSMYRLLARHERAAACPLKSVCNKQQEHCAMHISSSISAPLQDKGVGTDPVCPLSSQGLDGGAVVGHTAPIADISLHPCGVSMPILLRKFLWVQSIGFFSY